MTGTQGDMASRLRDSFVKRLTKWLKLAHIGHLGGLYGRKLTSKAVSVLYVDRLPAGDGESKHFTQGMIFNIQIDGI